MRSLLSITVNGKRRRVLRLAAPAPIPNLRSLSLRYDCNFGPYIVAGDTDYRDGAYVLSPLSIQANEPGTYRARAIEIRYTDGSTAESPLVDSIVIDVPAIPKRPEHVPVFAAL